MLSRELDGPERIVLGERPRAAVRLYCLPPAGAGADFFHPWLEHVPAWVEVCSVRLPGRGPRAEEPSLTDPVDLAARLAGIVDDPADVRPFAVFGHSVGALMAFETLRRLRQDGGRLPIWAGLSGLSGPQDDAYAKGLVPLLTAGTDGLAMLIGGPVPQWMLDDAPLMAAVGTPLLADCLLLLHHRHRAEPPLEVPLALYGGTQDPTTSAAQLSTWNSLFAAPAEPRLFDGAHMYPNEQTEALVKQVIADLAVVADLTVASDSAVPAV
ncbi:thioesterase [Streptomyces spinoverrucosus]|uniref:thioesterase II family protein n=1 Tax=Streptomyces spinoverrucosus TaxID=284043 RepID=UPI0018C4457A|nr:thioesterase [Streptomyces spinoverrucosus]MBG0857651.1 thioesterase [Streptomyces spinoverrucosus]